MKTITIQIGNSDNKLRQVEWADFIEQIEKIIRVKAAAIHFSGGSDPRASWQNFCWVFEASYSVQEWQQFLSALQVHGKMFSQDSIAVTVGETKFV